jgi:hypothetical protein
MTNTDTLLNEARYMRGMVMTEDTLLNEARKELTVPKVLETLTDAEQACVYSDTPPAAIVALKLAAIQVRTCRFKLGLGQELLTHTPTEVMLRTMLVDKEFMFWDAHNKRLNIMWGKKKGGK